MTIYNPTLLYLKRLFSHPSVSAGIWFTLFVGCTTFKLAVFNLLIVDSSTFPKWYAILAGFPGKLFVIVSIYLILIKLGWRWLLIGFYILQSLYIAINLMYYFSFQGYLHISQYLGLFSEAFDLITHAALPWDSRALFLFIDLPFLIGILIVFKRLSYLNSTYFFKPVFYTGAVIFLWVFYKWEVPIETPFKKMNNAYESDVSVVSNYGLIVFNIVDLFNYKNAQSHIKSLNYGHAFRAPVVDTIHPNIVVIQVESLDAYIINHKFKKEYVTPYLHSLSEHSIFYPYTLSYHLAGSTSDCEFSTINSVEPFNNYPSIKIRNYDYPNAVLKRLSSCGYSVNAFHGNRGTYFNRTFAFKKMGFHHFYDMEGMKIPEVGWGATDESVFNFVKGHIATQQRPFFNYVITMCTHEPFIFVKQYHNNPRFDGIKDGARRNYLNSMNYFDKVLKEFIKSVLTLAPDTYIIIYGDHTPSLPKCDYRRAMLKKDNRIFEFVPLFIITPDKKVYREKKLAASFLDVAPTVLSISKCSDSLKSHGQDLLSFPIIEKPIPYRKAVYNRKDLFGQIAKKR